MYPPQQPPAGGYQQQPGVPVMVAAAPTIVTQTVVMQDMVFRDMPKTMQCPSCHAMVTTTTSYETGGLTWLTAGVICLFGCWAGCCLIPFCIPELQDVIHRCPNCSCHVGTYRRI